SASTAEILRCPACRSELNRQCSQSTEFLVCSNRECAREYPFIGGIPVLIDDYRSLFSISEFVDNKATTFIPAGHLAGFIERVLPEISCNIGTARNYEHFASLMLERSPRPTVLVVGGSIVGKGMKTLLTHKEIELV